METADEIRTLTKLNSETEESVMNEIRRRAKEGTNAAYTPKFISSDLLRNLMQNGYKISKVTDSMGIESTKIEW